MKNFENLDLGDIVPILDEKVKIENNPFANFPPETLQDVLDLLEDHSKSP